MSGLTAVSLFAGIGGIDLAMERNGIHVTSAVEIDKAARGVLSDRFPHTTLFDDVKTVTAHDILATGFDPDRGIVTAGFPCQDLSVAGRRKGMGEGTRSGLWWEVVRLLGDLRPAWFVGENVPGLLSATCPCPGDGSCGSGCPLDGDLHAVPGGVCEGGCIPTHGGAMGAVLGSLGELGYGFAYRVLDARYFGLAQRRARVVIVGCLADVRRPVEVLLEPEGVRGDSAPVVASGSDAAGGLEPGLAVRGVKGERATALTARDHKGLPTPGDSGWNAVVETASTLQASNYKGIDAESAGGGHLLVRSPGGGGRVDQ